MLFAGLLYVKADMPGRSLREKPRPLQPGHITNDTEGAPLERLDIHP